MRGKKKPWKVVQKCICRKGLVFEHPSIEFEKALCGMQTKHPLCRKGPPAESMWDFYEKCAFKDQDFCRRPTLFYAETRPRWSAYGCCRYSNRNLKNSLTVDPPLVRKSIISLLWGLLWQGTWHFPHCRVSSSKDINDFLTAEFPSVRILDTSTQLLCTKPRNHLKPYPIIMRELCGICLCYLVFLSVLGLLK